MLNLFLVYFLLFPSLSLSEVIYVSLGQDHLYSCPRTAPIRWLINGNSLTDNSSSYTILPNGSLLITPVTQSIVGIHVSNQCCRESTSDCTSFFFLLSLIGSPIANDTSQPEFSDASLECNAPNTQPPPSFSWFRDSELVSSDRVYTLRNVSREDSGPYTCTINNPSGTRSQVMYLTVQYPPSVSIAGPGTRYVSAGGDIQLQCRVSGEPPPLTEWHFTEETAEISNASLITANSDNLTILAVSYSQSGYYLCFASNSLGSSQSSVRVIVLAKPQPPEVSITGTTSTSITVMWVYGNNGNSPLTSTFLEYKLENSVWVNNLISGNLTTGFTITQLMANTDYVIRVSVYNALGQSGYATLRVSTLPMHPPVPQGVRLLVFSPTTMQLVWEPPLLTHAHSPVLKYEYQLRPVGASAWSPLANCSYSQLAVEFQSLSPGTLYEARVRSVNSVGPGTFVTVQDMTNFSYPGQPGLWAVALDFKSIRVSWSASGTGGKPLLFWSLEISADAVAWILISTFDITQTEYDVTEKLRPNTTYFLRVWVNNELGRSPVSQVTVATRAKSPIGAVNSRISAVFITSNSIKISWLPVEYTDIAVALDYEIKYSLLAESIEPTRVLRTEQTSYTFQNLEPLSTYKFSIVARDGSEASASAVVFYFTTTLPSLRITPIPPSPVVGHKFELSCIFTEEFRGLFSPSYVSWYRGGANLRDISQNNQLDDFYLYKNHLVFPKFDTSQFGNYSCRVRDRFAHKFLQKQAPKAGVDLFREQFVVIVISVAVIGCFLAFLCLMCLVLCCLVSYRRSIRARNARYPVGIPKRSWLNQAPYSPLRADPAGFNPLNAEVDTHLQPQDSALEHDRLFDPEPTGEKIYTTSFLHSSSTGHTPSNTLDRAVLLPPGEARGHFHRLEGESSHSSKVDSDAQAPPLPPPFSTEEVFGDSLSLPKRLTITEGMSSFHDREPFESPPSSVRTAPNYDVISNDSAPVPLYQNLRPQTDSHVRAVEIITLPDNCISTDI